MTEQDKQQGGQINEQAKTNAAVSSSDKSSSVEATHKAVSPKTAHKKNESRTRKTVQSERVRLDSDAINKTPGAAPHKNKSSGVWLASLALLTAGAAIGGSYWLWQQGLAGEMAQQQQLQQAQQQLGLMQANITKLQQKFKTVDESQESQLKVFQQQQTRELDLIRKQLSQSRDPRWLLVEAEYLIRIASHRLQLADDIKTAVAALEIADQRLQSLNDPRLLPVRRQLSNDIAQLKAVSPVDVSGLALTLTALQKQLEQLPLQGRMALNNPPQESDATSPVVNEKNWTYFLADIWASLKGLVTIRRVDEKSVAIIAPEQRFFLYQNLALKLEAARNALLRNDDELYHQSLLATKDWLEYYFDQGDHGVQTILATLQRLDEVRLNRELPSVSASLKILQRLSVNQSVLKQHKQTKEKISATSTPMPKKVGGELLEQKDLMVTDTDKIEAAAEATTGQTQ